MTMTAPRYDTVAELRKVRQVRRFRDEPVPQPLVEELLQVARWTGSSINTQPWHFVVVTDRDQLAALAGLTPWIDWLAGAPLAIAIVLDGTQPAVEYFDEGRVTERLLIAARFLGLGAGTAWISEGEDQARGKAILGVPERYIARSVVALGYPQDAGTSSRKPVASGRRPLEDLVSYGTFQDRKR